MLMRQAPDRAAFSRDASICGNILTLHFGVRDLFVFALVRSKPIVFS